MNGAEKLEYLLEYNAMTPPILGDKVGVSSQAVRNWLSGTVPQVGVAVKVAKVFHPNGGDLLREWGYSAAADGLEHGPL